MIVHRIRFFKLISFHVNNEKNADMQWLPPGSWELFGFLLFLITSVLTLVEFRLRLRSIRGPDTFVYYSGSVLNKPQVTA